MLLRLLDDSTVEDRSIPAVCHGLEPRPTNGFEDEYENAFDRAPFALASSTYRGSIKATETI
jgi:hypothetical protein